jgi:putative membrane protein
MRDARFWVVVAVAALFGVVMLSALLGTGMMGGWGPMMGGGMRGAWGPGFGVWGLVMMLLWLLSVITIVLLVAWIIRQLAAGTGTATRSRALEILQERYARGEITREQFEQMRRDIEASNRT